MDNLAVSIQAVINTLNIIPVSGEQNLSHLLGSIQMLCNVRAELEKREVKTANENHTEN